MTTQNEIVQPKTLNMRKHSITIILILFTISSFAQDRQKMNDVFRAASKENKIIGWVFLGGGAGLIVAGSLTGD